MKIVLPIDIQKKIIHALEKAGSRETGGILMGEHIESDVFRIVDLTIQKSYGNVFSFMRLIDNVSQALKTFFDKTNRQYTRYNYLGEWHSHPSFSTLPSSKDIESMSEIVNDKGVGANFVMLLIVRLNSAQLIEGTATAFFPNSCPISCILQMEDT
ncbi:hypothetical protein X792_01235 [Dehalococcoides mccartyi CG1]|jgi:integrative and conjugative element protein (TIGR02256 family)|uniref:Mov34/MPN/PAD-1 family protein n=1 Tax=Dehalococcoides mccartyi TaxID=61435 RepID=UPI0004E060E2|nr:Mov34/MPN/PAD-1 family protein [Dehalococcoides mccartyi]AII57430.1 hypothetical protein X792_01235 [Dehalococcoides mccartyi CG1]